MKVYNKFILLVIIFILIPYSSQAISPNIVIDDKLVNFETQPINKNGVTYAPLESILEYLGAKVQLNKEDRSITAVRDNVFIRIHLDSKTASINGKNIILDQAPKTINNVVMLPVRFLTSAFNSTIDWDQETKTVLVDSNNNDFKYSYPFYLSKFQIERAKKFIIAEDMININNWILDNYSLKPYIISKNKYIQPYIVTPYSSLVSLYNYNGINEVTNRAVNNFSTYIKLFEPLSFNISFTSDNKDDFQNIQEDLKLSICQEDNKKNKINKSYSIDSVKRNYSNGIYITDLAISFYELENNINFFQPIILNILHNDLGNIEYRINLHDYR